MQVNRAEIRGEIVTSDLASGADPSGQHSQTISFRTPRVGLEEDPGLHDLLKSAVGAHFQGGEEDSAFKAVGTSILSILFVASMAVGLVLILRWMMGGGSPLTFGRSKAKVYAQKDLDVTFENVAGIDEAVAELREVVDFLKTPDKYQALGGRIPKGVLLVGPPGTGKTLLAKRRGRRGRRAVLQPQRLRFRRNVRRRRRRPRARSVRPGREPSTLHHLHRRAGCPGQDARPACAVGGHDEREQTLNQLLVEMDGFESNRGVIIMAATNRPETLDAALLRPGPLRSHTSSSIVPTSSAARPS